jgi:hypothetical protein
MGWHHHQTLDTKSCRLFKCAGPIAETRPVPAFFFIIFDSQCHNDNAKVQTWPVIAIRISLKAIQSCFKCGPRAVEMISFLAKHADLEFFS